MFRWKGENVATTEVADHLLMVDCIEEANVYGVKVPGTYLPLGIQIHTPFSLLTVEIIIQETCK